MVASILVVLTACFGTLRAQEPPRVAYWIAANDSRVLDEQELEIVASHAGTVVLNVPLKGQAPQYDFRALVARLHALNPKITVLMYAWPSRWYPGSRMGSSWYEGINRQPSYLLRGNKGELIAAGAKGIFLDVRQAKAREWWLERTKDALAETGADGVALDVALRNAAYGPPPLSALCNRNRGFCADYAAGIDSILVGLRRIRPQPKVVFNGFWNFRPGMIKAQEVLIPRSDAAIIEFFGFRSAGPPQSWEDGILPYLDLLTSYPTNHWLVFARGPAGYVDYDDDYEWQRYLYGSFLLGSGPNSLFKFGTTFQEPVHAGRSGGLDTYGDWELPLGPATSPFTKRGGAYERHFRDGIVLVVPRGGEPVRYTFDRTYFTPEGAEVSGTRVLQPGRALILVDERPALHEVHLGTAAWTSLGRSWQSAEFKSTGGSDYLHLTRLSAPNLGEHDLLLQPIRLKQNLPILHLQLRSTDKKLQLQFVAEVDDAQRKKTFVVVTMVAAGAPDTKAAAKNVGWFRSTSTPRALPLIDADHPVDIKGQWQRITLDGNKVLSATGRYKFRRWAYLRPVGTLDIASIDLSAR